MPLFASLTYAAETPDMAALRAKAEQGDPQAQLALGLDYSSGSCVPQDYAEAVKWWRKSAEQGNARAQYCLGIAYRDGVGVPQDYAEAVMWWRKSDFAMSKVTLGLAYRNGQGVPQDYAEALKLLRKAADEGLCEAQNNLGHMYANGQGVPQDFVEAHKWFNLAAARATDAESRKLATKNRDEAAALMTSASIAEAQKRAREWTEAFEKRQPAQ